MFLSSIWLVQCLALTDII